MFVTIGQVGLTLALLASLLSVILLFAGHFVTRREGAGGFGEKCTNIGYLLVFATTLLLSVCIAVLVYCFFAGDFSILYVATEHSTNTGSLSWLFKLAGLWGGMAGSLLLWAWFISLYMSFLAFRQASQTDELSNMALAIAGIVLFSFLCVLRFSTGDDSPFQATGAGYLTATGSLTGAATSWGMNPLLEHWAMAIHPPTLFLGYAGMTIPFAYAIAALIVNDPSKRWVDLCHGITVFAWLFLGVGIGLGAIWAYVVLGWGGYWGWDAVENASLLSWLIGVALIHSFTIYRKRGAFKRWAIMCACFAFTFVILGTFITRSGVVESVHAFSGDTVSLVFFLAMIIVSLAVGAIGLIIRRKSFVADEEIESLFSKNAAYYFNNVIMVTFAFFIAYLTLTSALPTWLPFGGDSLSTGTYEAVARPLGILYLAILAICPLLAWSHTDRKLFLSRIKWPALAGLVVFALLLVVYFKELLPVYQGYLSGADSTTAATILKDGPAWYYNALAIVGLAVASLLFCNTIYLFVAGVGNRRKHKGESAGRAFVNLFAKAPHQTGGYLAHLGMAIILVGLIGSNMFVAEQSVSLPSTEGASVTCDGYTLTYTGSSQDTSGTRTVYSVTFDVTDASGNEVGTVSPSYEVLSQTQQTKLNAVVVSTPLHDLFVAYQGVDYNGKISLDVRVNPLICFVWVGFGILEVGALSAFWPRRRRQGEEEPTTATGVPVGKRA
jgi:cytochrome c-type biogenesis protein CcmF